MDQTSRAARHLTRAILTGHKMRSSMASKTGRGWYVDVSTTYGAHDLVGKSPSLTSLLMRLVAVRG